MSPCCSVPALPLVTLQGMGQQAVDNWPTLPPAADDVISAAKLHSLI